jgi:hypothetical protein
VLRLLSLGTLANLTQASAARGRELGRSASSARTAGRLADLEPVIREVMAGGRITLARIADALNERHIPTSRGGHVVADAGGSRHGPAVTAALTLRATRWRLPASAAGRWSTSVWVSTRPAGPLMRLRPP